MKRCSRCKIEKPLEVFSKFTRRGKTGHQAYCKDCAASYYQDSKDHIISLIKKRKQQIRKETQQLLLSYLSNKSCADCGETDLAVLEFDHLRDKVANVGTLVNNGYRWATILKEIEKCDVVCANCHRRRTYTRSGCYRIISDAAIA